MSGRNTHAQPAPYVNYTHVCASFGKGFADAIAPRSAEHRELLIQKVCLYVNGRRQRRTIEVDHRSGIVSKVHACV